MTGYELSKEFETTLFEFWNAKHSQIYPELKSLNAEGLIQYRVEITGNVLERRSIRSPMKDGAIFRNGRKRSARSRRHLRMNPVCGSSSSTAPHRISSSDFLPTSFPSIKHLEHLLENQKKFDEIPPADDRAFSDYLVLRGAVYREEAALQWIQECIKLSGQRSAESKK